MTCLICSGTTVHFADGTLLGDQPVSYSRCQVCGSISADNPTWLERSYGEAIAKLDVGLLSRCLTLSNITAAVLRSEKLRDGRFLDWAGGYGALTRLMRDRGFDFRHSELMAPNIFASGFESETDGERYDLATAVEVLEHLVDPVDSLASLAQSSDLLLATTELLPTPTPKPGEWWYYTPETGQHVRFYTPESLQKLAERLGYTSVVSGSFVHLFHRRPISRRTAALIRSPRMAFGIGSITSFLDRGHSLAQADVDAVRSRLS